MPFVDNPASPRCEACGGMMNLLFNHWSCICDGKGSKWFACISAELGAVNFSEIILHVSNNPQQWRSGNPIYQVISGSHKTLPSSACEPGVTAVHFSNTVKFKQVRQEWVLYLRTIQSIRKSGNFLIAPRGTKASHHLQIGKIYNVSCLTTKLGINGDDGWFTAYCEDVVFHERVQ